MKDAGEEEWLDKWRRKQWRWAAKLLNQQSHKWASKTLLWDPVIHTHRQAERARKRPKKRWSDDFDGFLKDNGVQTCWKSAAKNMAAWQDMEDSFIEWCRL